MKSKEALHLTSVLQLPAASIPPEFSHPEAQRFSEMAACWTEWPTSVTVLFSFPWDMEFLILVGHFPFVVLIFE
jgi:hypothetical protein